MARVLKGLDGVNGGHIKRFAEVLRAEGVSAGRIYKYVVSLSRLSRVLGGKDFVLWSRGDVERVCVWLERQPFSPWTRQNYRVVLKRFFRWLRGGDDYPAEVKWIRTGLKAKDELLPDQLLTEEDVKRLVDAAEHIRDKAFIITLYESGGRVGELAAMKIGDVEFLERYATIVLRGKTGMRRIPIVAAMPYLLNWIENHPLKGRLDAPLWVAVGNINHGKRLSYGALAKILRVAAEKAKLKKHVHPHLLRHSRATFMAKRLTEAQMNVYFGWKQASRMPATYIHLSGRDVNEAVLGVYGLREPDKTDEVKLKPKECPRCRWLNMVNAQYCSRCGLILDVALTENMILYQEVLNREDLETLKSFLQQLKKGKIKVVG